MELKSLLTADYNRNIQIIDSHMRVNSSFDLVGRNVILASRKAKIYFIDGFCKDDVMVKILAPLMSLDEAKINAHKGIRTFADAFVPYIETDVVNDVQRFEKMVLSGGIGVVIEGFCEALLIDARTYPARAVGEPENDRVLRGPHDGFVETIVFNTALIRRRIRDVNLTMEAFCVGSKSQTDVVVCYLNGKVNTKALENVRKKLSSVSINSLTMSQQSLIECLVPKQRLNPFPKVRYTERPDAAAASVLEGSIIILTDNSPAAMIVPSGIFDFLQDTNDFYMSPLIGSYLRIVRMLVFALTILLVPTWFLLIQNPEFIPPWLNFLKIEEPNDMPVIVQLFVVEIVIDALRLASINTPNALSSSFAVVGALVLGEFAVSAGWFVPEVVLYMAFVAISNFAQPSFELGYAFKLFRMMMIALTALLNVWGYVAGLIIIALEIAFNKTVTGQSFLYPLVPFNARALLNLLFRLPISKKNN